MTQSLDTIRAALKLINREYETEYDGRMYTICSSCGAQDDQKHKMYCGWPKVDAAVAAIEAASLTDKSAGDGWNEAMIEKAANAWLDEIKRWGMRHNKGEKKPHEVFRFDDSNIGGSFSELHGFATDDEATEFFQKTSLHRAARAALSASPIPVDRRAVLKLPISQLEAFTSSGADCHPESPHAVVWKLRPALAASPSLAAPASKGPMEAEIERVAKAIAKVIGDDDWEKADYFINQADDTIQTTQDLYRDLARAALGAMQHE